MKREPPAFTSAVSTVAVHLTAWTHVKHKLKASESHGYNSFPYKEAWLTEFTEFSGKDEKVERKIKKTF